MFNCEDIFNLKKRIKGETDPEMYIDCFKIYRLTSVIITIALITLGGQIPAQADDDPDVLLNYCFAVWVGSGVYEVKSADKRIAVPRDPFAYTIRPAQCGRSAFLDRIGYKLLFSGVVALEEETDTDFTFGTVALVPGL
jgi:hypothetical protein